MKLYLMISIMNRDQLINAIPFLKDNNVDENFILLGHGTATSEMQNLLGLSESDRAINLSVVTNATWEKLKPYIPKAAVSMVIPLSSIGTKKTLKYLTESQGFKKGSESEMKNTNTQLLMVVCNQGYYNMVMDAARKEGAAGGTVLNARGTGKNDAEQFLGISLASEKEVILIATKTEAKNKIMEAIMKEAGLDTPAKSIIFSLPIDDTAGIKL